MVSRDDLERFLEGHRRAEARLRKETLRRVARLTVDEARAEYDGLVRVWETSRALGDRAAMDRRAIQERVALRGRFSGRR